MSPKLGDRLVAAGLVSREAVEQALEQQRLTGHRLGDSLVEMGLLGEATLLRFLASELKTRYVSAEKLARAQIPSELLDRVPVRLAEAHHFLPLAVDDERRILSIVAAEPQNEKLLRDVASIADVDEVYAYIALRSVVRAGIQKHYYADNTAFASLTSGPRASRADLAGIAAAYESAGSSKHHPPAVPLRLRGESSQARTPAARSSRPTTDESGLVAGRGAVGESDYLETLRVLVDQLERGHGEMRGHSAQLARQASLVASRLGLPGREVSWVALAAFLHDLGKGPLHLTLAGTARNPEWKAEAKKQALTPVHMFESVHLPAQVGGTLAQLYEAWDGSGTPQGAHGEDIAVGARILAAVDSWLDLTRNSGNAFGRLFTREQALTFMAEQAGKLFDPRVVEMLELLHSGELLRRRLESDGRQVLLADPEPAHRDAVAHALGRKGLVVHASSTLEGALEGAASADLWLFSVALGPSEVAEAAVQLRSEPALAGTPLLVTGPVDEAGSERLLQSGVSGLLGTGDPPELAAQVSEAMRERIASGAPARVVQGTSDELPPRDVLRILGTGRKSGQLVLRVDGTEGLLQFERGRVVWAGSGQARGEEALTQILRARATEFVYDPDALLMELPHLDTDLELVVRALEPA
jgi:HD-GYP domain-containing protein (c-di-GMP phosphodiesterase class II)/DNA-binding NarL/FixJ family response regulator